MANTKTLTTPRAVIIALGEGDKGKGVAAVMKLTDSGYTAVFNWLSQPTFPSNTYVVLTAALKAIRCTAPDTLWNMKAASAA